MIGFIVGLLPSTSRSALGTLTRLVWSWDQRWFTVRKAAAADEFQTDFVLSLAEDAVANRRPSDNAERNIIARDVGANRDLFIESQLHSVRGYIHDHRIGHSFAAVAILP